jgi:hypothetical protein
MGEFQGALSDGHGLGLGISDVVVARAPGRHFTSYGCGQRAREVTGSHWY